MCSNLKKDEWSSTEGRKETVWLLDGFADIMNSHFTGMLNNVIEMNKGQLCLQILEALPWHF